MSQGPQYTSCVEASDFKPLSTAIIAACVALMAGGTIAAIFSGGIGAIVAIASFVQLLRYILDFMLNGKLICLHRDSKNCNCGAENTTVCAVGEIADTEDVGEDKNPIEDIDNDYGINIILHPFNIKEFAIEDDPNKNLEKATADSQPQGDLIKQQGGMPIEHGHPKFTGYFRTLIITSDGKYNAWSEIVGRDYGWFGIVGPDQQQQWSDYVLKNAWLLPKKFSVPVLHCEFEGSRIHDMLAAIEAFSFGGSWCKKNWFFRLVCIVLQSIFSPIILAAVAAAWAAAKDGNVNDALVGGGTLGSKDQVIVRGRWCYDGGHSGWNEVHATRTIQKVFNIPQNPTEFKKFLSQWCDRLSEIPHIDSPGLKPVSTKEQETYDNQQKPENRWTLHPDVDGCQPDQNDNQPVIK